MDWSKVDGPTFVNLVFCLLILGFGWKRWRAEGIKAFILVGVGFTFFAISHVVGLSTAQGAFSSDTVAILKSPLIGVRVIGYVLVLIAMFI